MRMKLLHYAIIIILSTILLGCGKDDRKCLKSHTESQCYCSCINNIGVPIQNHYEVCDKYEENSTDE